MFVMKSYFNWDENTSEIIKSLLVDESCNVVARTRVKNADSMDLLGGLITNTCKQANKQEKLIGVDVAWEFSGDVKNEIHDTNQKGS